MRYFLRASNVSVGGASDRSSSASRNSPGKPGFNERTRYSVTFERNARMNVRYVVCLMRWMVALRTRPLSSLTRTSRLRLSILTACRRKCDFPCPLALLFPGELDFEAFHHLI